MYGFSLRSFDAMPSFTALALLGLLASAARAAQPPMQRYQPAPLPAYAASPAPAPAAALSSSFYFVSPSSSYGPSASPTPAPEPESCGCGRDAPFPPFAAPFSMISGDAGCAVNFIQFFGADGALLFSSGNASARSQPFTITCPGSTITAFSYACNPAAATPAAPAALLQVGRAACTDGGRPAVSGLDNVCSGVVGTAYASPADGSCSACLGAAQCPPPGAQPCALARCRAEPPPLAAPWAQPGRDAGRRSCSPHAGPAPGLALAWAQPAPPGAAFTGLTVGPTDSVYAARQGGFPAAVGLLKLEGSMGGAQAWASAVPTVSAAFAVGPWRTLLGGVANGAGERAAGVLSADSGALLGAMGGSLTGDARALGDVALGEDLAAWAYGGAGALPPGPPPDAGAAYLAWLPPYVGGSGGSSARAYTAAPAGGAALGLLLPALHNATLFHAGAASGEEVVAHAAGAAADASGAAALRWFYRAPGGAVAALSVAWDGSAVYFGAADGSVTCLAGGSGEVLWRAPAPCPQNCTFSSSALGALSADGETLYMPVGARSGGSGSGSGFAGVLALDARSGNVTWSLPTAGAATALALDGAGRLYVGAASGAVYAVAAGSGAVLALYQAGGGGVLENGLALGEAQGGALYVATPQQVLALRSGARAEAGGAVAA